MMSRKKELKKEAVVILAARGLKSPGIHVSAELTLI